MHACHRSRAPSDRGFNLVELAVAIGIVSGAILPIVGLLVLALGMEKEARDDGVAARIGREMTAMVEQADHGELVAWSNGTLPAEFYYDGEGRLLGFAPAMQAQAVHTARIAIPAVDVDLGAGPSSNQRRFSVLVAHRPGTLGATDIAAVLAGNPPVGEVHRFPGLATRLEK